MNHTKYEYIFLARATFFRECSISRKGFLLLYMSNLPLAKKKKIYIVRQLHN